MYSCAKKKKEVEQLMKALGILVDEEGNYRTFGKWRNRKKRSINCCDDWHDDSFRNDIRDTEWFNNLNIPYDDSIQFSNQLDLFGRHGKIIITNGMDEEDETDFIRLIITAPDKIGRANV